MLHISFMCDGQYTAITIIILGGCEAQAMKYSWTWYVADWSSSQAPDIKQGARIGVAAAPCINDMACTICSTTISHNGKSASMTESTALDMTSFTIQPLKTSSFTLPNKWPKLKKKKRFQRFHTTTSHSKTTFYSVVLLFWYC